MEVQQAKELKAFCARLRRNDARLSVLDRAFYYRFCSLLCNRDNAELVKLLTDSLAKNTSVEDLTLDGAILFRNDEAAQHLESVKQHLVENSEHLKHIRLRWCGSDAELLQAVAASPSLQTLDMHIQHPVDVEHLLSTSSSMKRLSIRSSARVTGLRVGMRVNRTVTSLKLMARLRDEDVQELCEGLAQNGESVLKLLQVKVDSLAQATSLRDYLLSPNCRLEDLDLSHSDLHESEIQRVLLEGIGGSASLKKLVMNHASLGRSSGLNREAWLPAFSRNRSLEELHLASNVLGTADVATLVDALAQNNPALRHLNLEMNLLTSDACAMLSKELRTARWTKLSVSFMEFASSAEATVLKKALQANDHLNEVTFGALWFTSDSEEDNKLALNIVTEGLVGSTSLHTIAVDGFGDKAEDVAALLLGLSLGTKMKKLVLRNSKFSSGVCNYPLLCLLLSENPLEELDLGQHTFAESTVEILAQALRVNKKLKTLRLYQCQVEDRDWKALFEALEQNEALEFLDLQCVSAKEADGERILKRFCRSLPRMKGLKRLSFHGPAGFSPRDEVIPGFLLALGQNLNIQEVTTEVSSQYEEKMEYILDLNKAGRNLLRSTHTLPSSVWPNYLARMASHKDPTMLFYTLGASLQKWIPQEDPVKKLAAMKRDGFATGAFALRRGSMSKSKPSIFFAKSA